MDPVAISIGSFSIYWYGILISSAMLLGYLITLHNCRRFGLDSEQVDPLLFKLALALLIGARLGAIIPDIHYYLADPSRIFLRAGLGSHGAILTVMLVGIFLAKRANLSYWLVADAIAPAIPLGHVFVRIGNFINGELYGSPTALPWGVEFLHSGQPVHPVQLYEAAISLVLLVIAFRWVQTRRYPGYVFFRVMIAQSLIKFLLDFIRQHSPLYGPFILTQWIALGLVLTLGILLWRCEHQPSGC